MSSDWVGEERRGIPIHVLTYLDAKFDAHIEKVNDLVNQHKEDEMRRYKEILDHVDRSDTAAEDRHNALIDKLSEFIGTQELINSAFIEDHKGEPDYNGHKQDHHVRAQRARTWSEFWTDAFKKVGTGAVYAAAVAIGLAVWEAFKIAVKQ